MKNAEGDHGVTANTRHQKVNRFGFTEQEVNKVIRGILEDLEHLSGNTERDVTVLTPIERGRLKMSAKSGNNRTPTFLPGGMLLEDDKGKTRAIWDPEPKKPHVIRYRIGIVWCLFAIGFILGATDVTVPAIWPVGMTALSGYLGYVILRTGIRRHAPNRPRTPERRQKVAPYYSRYLNHDWDTRIGDAERDQVISELGAHFAAGRLDADEYDDRSSAAIAAKTHGDLSACMKNLPVIGRDGKTR